VIAPRRAGLDMLTASTVGMQLWRSISASVAALFTATHLATWRFWLFVYLAFAIGSSVELSREDLAGAREGLIVLVLAVLVFNLATLWIGSVARHAVALAGWIYGPLFVVIAIAVLINGMVAGALSIVPARRD
jgi:hypothetical protein